MVRRFRTVHRCQRPLEGRQALLLGIGSHIGCPLIVSNIPEKPHPAVGKVAEISSADGSNLKERLCVVLKEVFLPTHEQLSETG